MEPTGGITAAALLKHGMIALFGGVAHAINASRNGETKGWTDFTFLTILSSFFGLLFGFIAIHFLGANEYLTVSISGVGGFLGVESLKMIIPILRRLLGVPEPKSEDEEPRY
jgi:uncharacterized membrane protein HdeD (DUF308 family)